MQQLKRQLLKQFQPKRRKVALLKVGQRRSWPRGVATEKAAVEAALAEEGEGGPLEGWTKKELAEGCSN